MARNKKYEKNLEKLQSYLDGTHQGKIQSGFIPEDVHEGRKVGDIWTDSDGVEWEQKKGYRSKVSKMGNVGIFDKQCKDCDKPCTKSFDVDTYNRMSRCYKCQVQFEEDLKWNKENRIGKRGNKWQFWVKLQELKRWDAIDKEVEQFMMNRFEENKKNPFDKSVVNAMANANISMEIKKNKT